MEVKGRMGFWPQEEEIELLFHSLFNDSRTLTVQYGTVEWQRERLNEDDLEGLCRGLFLDSCSLAVRPMQDLGLQDQFAIIFILNFLFQFLTPIFWRSF